MDQFEREEDEIIRQINDGEISQSEGNRQLRELRRDYQAVAEESAQRAYDDELQRW